jgi:3-phytase
MHIRKLVLTLVALALITISRPATAAVEAELKTYTLTDLASIGKSAAGQEFKVGGFSGLTFESKKDDGTLVFTTHTDRGPNGETFDLPDGKKGRPFALPAFQPAWYRIEINPATGTVKVVETIGLTNKEGKPLTGLPNLKGEKAGFAYADEVPTDLMGKELTYDPYGIDGEGIAKDANGTYWMVDEYRPGIYNFDKTGKLIERYVPKGSNKEAVTGVEALPAVLGQRRANRGFEAVVIQDGKLYAFVQSPLDNPDTAKDDNSKKSTYTRIVEFDLAKKEVTAQYLNVLGSPKADKIGDAVALEKGVFVVMERDDEIGEKANKKLYKIDLKDATNLNTLDESVAGVNGTLELMTADDLKAKGIKPVAKELYIDLIKLGYDKTDKPEGLALVDANTMVVVNDNDFAVTVELDLKTGMFGGFPKTTPIQFGVITLKK